MIYTDSAFDNLLQRNVAFYLDDKVIKKGKLVLVIKKDYYFIFNIYIDNILRKIEYPYPFILDNIKNGFDIFGVDLMIRDDFTVVLIECNDKGGYTPKSDATRIMIEKLLFNWINDVIFRPAFQNKKPIDHKPLFTKQLNN